MDMWTILHHHFLFLLCARVFLSQTENCKSLKILWILNTFLTFSIFPFSLFCNMQISSVQFIIISHITYSTTLLFGNIIWRLTNNSGVINHLWSSFRSTLLNVVAWKWFIKTLKCIATYLFEGRSLTQVISLENGLYGIHHFNVPHWHKHL